MAEVVDDTTTFTIALKATSATIVNCENSCDLLLEYDKNNDGIIDETEASGAAVGAAMGIISNVQSKFINDAHVAGSINKLCTGCYTGIPSGTHPIPPLIPPESAGDPTDTTHQHILDEGEYAITVTKRNYDTVHARIKVLSDGTVSCEDVTGGSCGGSGYPRVETTGANVKVYMKYASGAIAVPGAVCDWIKSLGGWKAIDWDDVLKIYDAYLNPSSPGVGFAVVWDDVLTTYSYYLDIPMGQPTLGNNSRNGCGFT